MIRLGELRHLLTLCLWLTVNVTAIPFEEFYPFGEKNGDALVNRTVDGSSPVIPFPLPLAPVLLSPQVGNQLGGTPVVVTGPCFQPNGTTECSFGGISTPGIFVSCKSAICISPAMDALGRVEVTVEVRRENGDITFQGKALFYSSKYALCCGWINNKVHSCNVIMILGKRSKLIVKMGTSIAKTERFKMWSVMHAMDSRQCSIEA